MDMGVLGFLQVVAVHFGSQQMLCFLALEGSIRAGCVGMFVSASHAGQRAAGDVLHTQPCSELIPAASGETGWVWSTSAVAAQQI